MILSFNAITQEISEGILCINNMMRNMVSVMNSKHIWPQMLPKTGIVPELLRITLERANYQRLIKLRLS